MRITIMALLLYSSVFAGFFPNTVHTSISKTVHNSIALKKPFPIKGMSGVVIHRYSDDLNAITNRIFQISPTQAKLIKGQIVYHEELPSINTKVKAGDKVIGGYLYQNVLLLAPDAKSYSKVTSQYKKNWIHPDIFALFLATEGDTVPTKENLKKFAKTYQVGLVAIIAQNRLKLFDPISGYTIKQKTISGTPKKGKSPFYMRFDKIDTGWFSKNTTKDYYSIVGAI